MVIILYTGEYAAMLVNLLETQPDLESAIDVTVKYFIKNPLDTRLNTHTLRKKMHGKYAFSITENVRVVFEWVGKSTARFLAIGHHHTVHRKK